MSRAKLIKESIIDTLPLELLIVIFDSLPLTAVAKCGLVSHELKEIVDNYMATQLKIKEVACGQYHSLILLEKGRVLAVGSNQYGQLGFPSKISQFIPKEILDIEPIEHLSAGDYHTLMLSKKKNLWVMGLNADRQLSFINQEAHDVELQQWRTELNIQTAIAVDYTSAFIDANQTIHSFGNEGLKPHLINGQLKLLPDWVIIPDNFNIADITVGKQHALLLTKEGDLYGFGSNDNGLLGLDNQILSYDNWVILPINKVKKIKATSLGSLLLTDNNELMVTGINSMGQFKQSSSTFLVIANDVKTFDANDFHTLYVNHSNELHALGSNEEGQLGIGKLNKKGQLEPALMLARGYEPPKSIPIQRQAQKTPKIFDLLNALMFHSNQNTGESPQVEEEEDTLNWDDEDEDSSPFFYD